MAETRKQIQVEPATYRIGALVQRAQPLRARRAPLEEGRLDGEENRSREAAAMQRFNRGLWVAYVVAVLVMGVAAWVVLF